jgi:predicted  nucleic acid-binding Zn-ribbon protein
MQAVIDAVQETFKGPDAQEIADELFERVVEKVESNLDFGDIARELDLGDIAGEIDIRDLAEQIELDELAEHLADHMQRKLLKDWNVKETVETVVERMLSAQLADIRVSLAHMDLERRTLRSAVEDLRAEVEALKAPIAALRPLFKFMEALKS